MLIDGVDDVSRTLQAANESPRGKKTIGSNALGLATRTRMNDASSFARLTRVATIVQSRRMFWAVVKIQCCIEVVSKTGCAPRPLALPRVG